MPPHNIGWRIGFGLKAKVVANIKTPRFVQMNAMDTKSGHACLVMLAMMYLQVMFSHLIEKDHKDDDCDKPLPPTTSCVRNTGTISSN